MPIQKTIKKVSEVAKAVASGYKDYSAQVKTANRDAEDKIRPTYGVASSNDDAERVTKETNRLKKERNVSLRNSVRSKLGL